jgi:hypothetical protein
MITLHHLQICDPFAPSLPPFHRPLKAERGICKIETTGGRYGIKAKRRWRQRDVHFLDAWVVWLYVLMMASLYVTLLKTWVGIATATW